MHKKNLVHIAQDKAVTIENVYENSMIGEVLSYNTNEKRFETKAITHKGLWTFDDYFYSISYTNPVSGEQQRLRIAETDSVYAVNRGVFVPVNELTFSDVLKVNTAESQRVYVCQNCGEILTESHQQYGAHYVWCDDEIRHRTLQGQREFYEQNPDALIRRKGQFIKARKHPISALEQWIIALDIPELIFTGNGDLGIEIALNKHYFPDFVVQGERKIVEVGDIEHWHTEREIQQRVWNYKRVGYDCLYLTNEDIKKRPDDAEAEVMTFVYNHDVSIDCIERYVCGRRSPHRYTLDVQDYHGFFANGALVKSGF